MDSILYKHRRLLTEGYNFSNADEVMSAIKANQVGVKVNNSFKAAIEKNPNSLKKTLKHFFEKCEQLGVKETTYGVQLLLSKTDCLNNDDDDDDDDYEDYYPEDSLFSDVIKSDGFYEILKSYKKPWVKEMPAFQSLMERRSWDSASIDTLHELEKDIQREQENHGKKSKGSGEMQDVKVLYNDGTWRLLQPTSFQGEKAAAFYIKNGKETPTEWCTRCDNYYYNHYTQFGPLYIIRNMKSGKSYQLAFTEYSVEFLDQNDEKGDKITTGDLNPIPDNLLKLIKHPKNGRTLLDYKTSRNKALSAPEKKGYLKTDNVGIGPGDFKYGPTVQLDNNICKKDILNFSYDSFRDSFSDYFTSKKPIEVSTKYVKRHKATAYFIKGKEDALMVLQTLGKEGKSFVDGTILETKKFQDLTPDEKYDVYRVAQKDFGVTKSRERAEMAIDRKNGLMKRYNTKSENISQEDHDKLVDNINSRLDFGKSKLFKGLNAVHIPYFGRTGEWGTKALYGKTLVKDLSLIPTRELEKELSPNMRNSSVTVIFKHLDGETNLKATDTVTWNKANAAILITGYGNYGCLKLSKEEFEFCKKIAIEIQKEFIKDPDYRKLNMQRKIEQEAQSQKENRGKTLTKQQLENTVGKDMAHRLTHLDNEKPGTRFPVHVMKSINQATHRPDLYEEVKYFNY